MKRRIKDFSHSPPAIIQNLMDQYKTQAAKQRILIIYSIINSWWQTATPANCQASFYATGIFQYNLEKVISNRFVRTTTDDDAYPQERGISKNTQIITSKKKKNRNCIRFLSNYDR